MPSCDYVGISQGWEYNSSLTKCQKLLFEDFNECGTQAPISLRRWNGKDR